MKSTKTTIAMSGMKQLAILSGLALGFCLIYYNDARTHLAPVIQEPIRAGLMNIAINPKYTLMFRPSKKSVTLRLGDAAKEKLHVEINSISVWQLRAAPSSIKDAATQEVMNQFDIVIGVNGGDMHPLSENRGIIASGKPFEKSVDLTISLLPKKPSLPTDLSRNYQCDLIFDVIGVF